VVREEYGSGPVTEEYGYPVEVDEPLSVEIGAELVTQLVFITKP
jgi:hypothetical protein